MVGDKETKTIFKNIRSLEGEFSKDIAMDDCWTALTEFFRPFLPRDIGCKNSCIISYDCTSTLESTEESSTKKSSIRFKKKKDRLGQHWERPRKLHMKLSFHAWETCAQWIMLWTVDLRAYYHPAEHLSLFLKYHFTSSQLLKIQMFRLGANGQRWNNLGNKQAFSRIMRVVTKLLHI